MAKLMIKIYFLRDKEQMRNIEISQKKKKKKDKFSDQMIDLEKVIRRLCIRLYD